MKSKLFIYIFSILILLIIVNSTFAQTVTQYDGEYATDLTIFEYELSGASDPGGWLDFYWGFNTTGDSIRFEIGTSVLSEDHIDVLYDGVYKIPMDIYLNDVEFDVNANATYFNYWEEIFWGRMLLPIEDGQYNVFDVLEDQDPASYDVKGEEVSYFTTDSELVYEYSTGILLTWTSTVTYDFVLSYIAPPEITSETTLDISSETSSKDGKGLTDRLPISSATVFIAIISFVFVRKLTFISKKN